MVYFENPLFSRSANNNVVPVGRPPGPSNGDPLFGGAVYLQSHFRSVTGTKMYAGPTVVLFHTTVDGLTWGRSVWWLSLYK